jgi:mycothiol synthase
MAITSAGRVDARLLPTGLTLRELDRDSDYEAMVAVLDAAKAVDGIEKTRTPRDYRMSVEARRALGAAPAVLLAEVDERVVGWCISAAFRPNIDRVRQLDHVGYVHPDWRARGIGTALITASQTRLVGLVRADDRAVLTTEVGATEVATRALLEGLGYDAVRFFANMVRPTLDDLPDDTLPDGIEVRPSSKAVEARVFRAFDEAFRDHWAWIPLTDEFMDNPPESATMSQFDVWQVAWDGDEVVAGVLGFINRDENAEYGRRRGYTEGIFTRRAWRHRGIAAALIARNLRLLRDLGMEEAALGVDTQNRSNALALYERSGFREVSRNLVYERAIDAA